MLLKGQHCVYHYFSAYCSEDPYCLFWTYQNTTSTNSKVLGLCDLLSSCVPQKYALMGSPLSPLSGNIIKSGNRDCPSSVGTRYCGQDCQICYGKLKKTA